MATNPKISILMPVYNGGKYLAETLDSVIAQTFTDWEIVFMDGGSKDDTIAIAQRYAEKYPNIHITSEKDEGPYHAIHKALAVARGEYVLVLCASDGYLETKWLEMCANALDSDKELSVVWGIPFDITEDGQPKGPHFMYAHFLQGGGDRKPFFRELMKRLTSPSAFLRLLKKVNASHLATVKNVIAGSKPPEKDGWFRYWLRTGTIFPDGNMCMPRQVWLDCLPPYKAGTREVGDWMQLFFDINSRGYLSHCFPIAANFTRNDQIGSVTKRAQEYNDMTRKRYFAKLGEYCADIEAHPEKMVFRDRNRNPLPNLHYSK